MDSRQIENLVRHAHDAQRFAEWVHEPLDEPVTGSAIANLPANMRRRDGSAWLRASGVAAAAALAIGAGYLAMRTPTPVHEKNLITANRGTNTADSGRVSGETADESRTPAHSSALLAAQHHHNLDADIARLAFLDPGAIEGTPSLTAERSVLLAVYSGAPEGCDCVDWRVADDHGVDQVNLALLSNAMSSPCRSKATDITIYQVSGPRFMLPFHDEQARSLAACLAKSPEECLIETPEAAVDHIAADTSSGRSFEDLCSTALAYCVPNGLKVSATRLELSIR